MLVLLEREFVVVSVGSLHLRSCGSRLGGRGDRLRLALHERGNRSAVAHVELVLRRGSGLRGLVALSDGITGHVHVFHVDIAVDGGEDGALLTAANRVAEFLVATSEFFFARNVAEELVKLVAVGENGLDTGIVIGEVSETVGVPAGFGVVREPVLANGHDHIEIATVDRRPRNEPLSLLEAVFRLGVLVQRSDEGFVVLLGHAPEHHLAVVLRMDVVVHNENVGDVSDGRTNVPGLFLHRRLLGVVHRPAGFADGAMHLATKSLAALGEQRHLVSLVAIHVGALLDEDALLVANALDALRKNSDLGHVSAIRRLLHVGLPEAIILLVLRTAGDVFLFVFEIQLEHA